MHRIQKMHQIQKVIGITILMAITLVGCEPLTLGRGKPKSAPLATPIPTSQPAVATDDPPPATADAAEANPAPSPVETIDTYEAVDRGPVMARINGREVYMSELHEILVRAHGLQESRQLIATELVNQTAEKRNLTVSEDELAAEHTRTLGEILPKDVTAPDQRERLLQQLMAKRNYTPQQWKMSMRRNVLLDKILSPSIKISEDDLTAEFSAQYGRKVVVRHIEVQSSPAAQGILQSLRNGASFETLARTNSKSPFAENSGLMPPIGPHVRQLPDALRDAAIAMTKSGEISPPIQIGSGFHILKLERVIKAKEANFEAMKVSLTASLRRKKLRDLRPRMLAKMIRLADIEYVDPILKAKTSQPSLDKRP